MTERLVAIAACRVESGSQLPSQRAAKPSPIELAEDALPDAATRRKQRPVEDCFIVVLHSVRQTAAAQVPADLARIRIEHAADRLLGARFLAKDRLADDRIDIGFSERDLDGKTIKKLLKILNITQRLLAGCHQENAAVKTTC